MYSKYFIIWTIDKLLVLLQLKTVLDGISQKTGVGMNMQFLYSSYLFTVLKVQFRENK